jgi:hypothetical protein
LRRLIVRRTTTEVAQGPSAPLFKPFKRGFVKETCGIRWTSYAVSKRPSQTAETVRRAVRRSFHWSLHLALPGMTEPHQLNDGPDLSCKDSMGQHAVDGSLLSCNGRLWSHD